MVEITNTRELETWLKGKSQSTFDIISAREGLRYFANAISRFERDVIGVGNAKAVTLQRARCSISEIISELKLTPNLKITAKSASGIATTAVAGAANSALIGATPEVRFAVQETMKHKTDFASIFADAMRPETSDFFELFEAPLWSDPINEAKNRTYIDRFRLNHLHSYPEFKFWIDWYQGYLDGNPMDWDIQERIALIPDEDWEKGAVHIAGMIEDILKADIADKAAKALAEIDDLDEFHPRGATPFESNPRAVIGGNCPPDQISPVEFTAIQYSLTNLSAETSKPKPDPSALNAALTTLSTIAMRILYYAAKKADLALDVFIKTIIPIGTTAGIAYLATKIWPLIEALRTFINIL